jgi:preflagellin peptidase FlaK
MFEVLGDVLRLLAVPLFGWAALRDVRTRRVPNWVWLVLGALGAVLLVVDLVRWYPFEGWMATRHLIQVGVSLLFVAPLGYLFWRIGGFGGADAKALMALSVLFPTYPAYFLPQSLVALGLPPVLPFQPTAFGVFSLTILTDTVLIGMAFPLVLAARNLVAGRAGKAMFFGRVVPVATLPAVHGRLFETREGFTRSGLDLDALRMYLRWRGCSLAALRDDADSYRDPESIGETNPPTDGVVDPEGVDIVGEDSGWLTPDGGEEASTQGEPPDLDPDSDLDDGHIDDPWGAEQFLDDIDHSAYGTDAETLREGLETVVAREEVWISPGLPFIVPMFVGLVVALTYGDLLYGLLLAVGLV